MRGHTFPPLPPDAVQFREDLVPMYRKVHPDSSRMLRLFQADHEATVMQVPTFMVVWYQARAPIQRF